MFKATPRKGFGVNMLQSAGSEGCLWTDAGADDPPGGEGTGCLLNTEQ